MWDMRRNIDTRPMPSRRSVIQFVYSDLPPPRRDWWLIVSPGEEVDLCSVDPGFDIDLYVETDLRTHDHDLDGVCHPCPRRWRTTG